ncbi:MAG: Smr/MutS family protein [Alcanivorax sp.]
MSNKEPENNNDDEPVENDDELWAEITKDITPLRNKNTVISDGIPPKKPKKSPTSGARNPHETTKSVPTSRPQNTSGHKELDHRTKERLRRGQIGIDGRIDLHGMSQNQAYDALLRYIPSAYTQGKRCILIVTGKGHQRHGDTSLLNRTDGVLKRNTPLWLRDPPLDQYILDIQTAKPKDGGAGALYVLLRRNR